jgi:hypothetical protein
VGRLHLYRAIDEERLAQDVLWGGPANDDRNTPRDWVAIACRHLGMAVDDSRGHDPARWRRQMLRVAALCVAAVESQDRLAGDGPAADNLSHGPGY